MIQSKKENIVIVEDLDEFQDQDLRILKSLIQDKKLAKEFLDGTYQIDFFKGKSFQFATWFLQHFKIHDSLPTQRILIESYPEQKELFTEVYSRLHQTEFDPLEFGYDLEKLKNRYAKEQFLKIKEIDFDSPNWEKELKKADAQLNKIKSLNKVKQKEYYKNSVRNYIDEFVDNYVKKLKDPKFDRGILTGYSYFDYVTNGLRDTDLLIICGESASGKSIFLNNIAIQMWMQDNTINSGRFSKGHNVLYFSLEMPFKNCFRRTMAKLADVPVNSIRDACLNPDELERFGKAIQFIKQFPYDFDIIDVPRGLTVEKLEEIYLECCKDKPEEKKPKIIGLDYLGLMEDDSEQGDDWLKLGKIAGKFHEFLRDYNLIGETAVQLNRPNQNKKDESELIGMHRIGRSSLIVHHATHCVQIQTRQNEECNSDFPYHLIKTRDGEKGSHNVTKNFRNSSIIDVPYVPFENIEGNQPEDFTDYALEFFDKLEL